MSMREGDPVAEQQFLGHKATVTSLSFSPNEQHLISSSLDNSFIKWNLLTPTGSLRYKSKNLPVNHACYSPKGGFIASCQGQFVRLWMSSVQGKSVEFKAHMSTVQSVQYSPDGGHLVTASNDKIIKIWKTALRRFLVSLTGHTNWVRYATYSTEGSLIVSCGDDKTVRIWDPISGKLVHTFHEIRGVPRHVEFHPSSLCLGVAMDSSAAKVYDIRSMKLIQYYSCHQGAVNTVAFHPSGNYLLTGGEDKTCKMLDLIEGRAFLSLEGHSKPVTRVSFSKSGEHFATASEDKNVLVWRTNLDVIGDIDDELKESFIEYDEDELPKIEATITGNNQTDIPIYRAGDYEDSSSDPEIKDVDDSKSDLIEPPNLEVGLSQLLDGIGQLAKKVSEIDHRISALETETDQPQNDERTLRNPRQNTYGGQTRQKSHA